MVPAGPAPLRERLGVNGCYNSFVISLAVAFLGYLDLPRARMGHSFEPAFIIQIRLHGLWDNYKVRGGRQERIFHTLRVFVLSSRSDQTPGVGIMGAHDPESGFFSSASKGSAP